MALEPGKSIRQTVKRDGVRVVIKQTMNSKGEVTTKVEKAHTLEDDLQASQVSRLKGMADYGKRFLLAGDMNAGKRGPVAASLAKRTGMEAGEPDLRIYVLGDDDESRLLLIENKNGGNYLTTEQKDRHAALELIGFPVWTIKTDDPVRAADCAEVLVRFYQRRTVDFVKTTAERDYPEISRNFVP